MSVSMIMTLTMRMEADQSPFDLALSCDSRSHSDCHCEIGSLSLSLSHTCHTDLYAHVAQHNPSTQHDGHTIGILISSDLIQYECECESDCMRKDESFHLIVSVIIAAQLRSHFASESAGRHACVTISLGHPPSLTPACIPAV